MAVTADDNFHPFNYSLLFSALSLSLSLYLSISKYVSYQYEEPTVRRKIIAL